MKNLEATKKLLEEYKSITLEQLKYLYKEFSIQRGKTVMSGLTAFSTTDCPLCKAANNMCSRCIYSFRLDVQRLPCMDIIYKEMEKASSAEELFNAIQKRISYLTHVIELYELKELKV